VEAVKTADPVQELFNRLSARGIDPADYWKIKQIVQRIFPQARYRFFRQFNKHTIRQVLRQIDQARDFLAKDFILPAEARTEIEKSIVLAEMLAWMAILEINCRVGPWTIQTVLLPTGTFEDGDPQYDHPNLKITAIHRETGEERVAIIPGSEQKFPMLAKAWRRAYEHLGIWDLAYLGAVYNGVLSEREPQGWPIFTQVIIPSLYEHLLPHYEKLGHHSQKRDGEQAGKAQFQKEIFDDMLSILRIEQPGFFDDATRHRLISVIQRYLAKKAEITGPAKHAETPQIVTSL
jgi:hypothetical protein